MRPIYFVDVSQLVSKLPGHVYWLDQNNIYLGCNELQAEDLGLVHPDDIIGKTNYDLPWRQQASQLDEANNEVLRSGKEVTIEEKVRFDDEIFTFLSKKVPLHNEKKEVIGVLGISFDITQRKKLEEEIIKAKELAERESRLKTEFIRDISHDLNTPLNGILGFSNLLLKENLEDEARNNYIQTLIDSTRNLISFIDQIHENADNSSFLESRWDNSFNIEELVQGIIDFLKPSAFTNSIQLELYFGTSVPKFLAGNSQKIYRIILELVTNAVKFTTQGMVNVYVSHIPINDRGITLKVTVEDTGIGIPENIQNFIFDKFFRGPRGDNTATGLGLGLHNVRQWIKDLTGELHLQSKEKIGSKFTVLLPMQLPLLDNYNGIV